jgi:hypothetical protein
MNTGMEIVRTRPYAKALKRLAKLGASEPDIRGMEDAIAADPRAGDVIVGGGGIRKVRFGFGGRGKRGGGRSIYYAWDQRGAVIMLTAYAKADKDDLAAGELQLLAELIKELRDVQDQEE